MMSCREKNLYFEIWCQSDSILFKLLLWSCMLVCCVWIDCDYKPSWSAQCTLKMTATPQINSSHIFRLWYSFFLFRFIVLKIVDTPNILSCDEARKFWISWKDNTFTVGEGEITLCYYEIIIMLLWNIYYPILTPYYRSFVYRWGFFTMNWYQWYTCIIFCSSPLVIHHKPWCISYIGG